MITLILISIYIVTIFLGRYIDIKICIHIHQIHYKTYIMWGLWFIPVFNLIYPLLTYIEYEINTRKKDIKHNKFINWFFVGVNYKANHEIKFKNEFDKFFNKTRSVDSNTIEKVKQQLKYNK